MRVLAFVHLPVVLTSAPLLTGAAVLALALALSACGAPQRIELSTAPITLPTMTMLPTATAASTAPASRSPMTGTAPPTPAPPTRSAAPPHSTPPAVSTPPTVSAPAAAPPLVDARCGNQPPAARPTAILLACADGSLRLEDITYSSYGAAVASGHAVMHANTCRPNCANGVFRDYPAGLVLDEVAGGLFTRVTLHYSGAGPDGRSTASYPIQ